jgi:PKD repeat protein
MRLPAMAVTGLRLCLAAERADAQAADPAITADPASGRAPLHVMFTISPVPSGAIIDFGDGTTGSLQPAPVCYTCPPLATASHVYQRPGSYVARLVANGKPIAGAAATVRAN